MEGEKVDSLRRLAPHRLDAGQLSSYAGIFHCPELGVRYPIWLEEGKLYLRRGGAPREQLRLAGKDSGGQILFAGPDFFLQYAEGDGEEISGFCLSTERVRNLVFVRVRGD
jgi:hypothetical protein